MVTLALDIGGTRMKLALLENGKIVKEGIVESYRDDKYQKNLDKAEAEGRRMMAELGVGRIDGLGIAFPGLVNPKEKVVVSANGKFVDAIGYDLTGWVKRTFDCPFILDNDSNAALIGEMTYGCAQDTKDAVMMIFGTGVGAAAVMDGRLIRGKHYQAACIGGHMVIEAGPDATPCNCGNIGCMEANASSWALPLFAKKDPLFESSALSKLDVIDYTNLKACADAGDELAVKLLRRSLDCWSANLCNLIVAYDPEVIILSGGIARMGEALRKPLEEHVHKYAWTPWGHPDIRLAANPEASVVLGLHKLTLDEIEGKTAF